MTRYLKSVLTILLFAAISVSSLNAQEQQFFLHTVTAGQGLYSISRMYGVTEDDIIRLNPGSETVIRIGQELKIPVARNTESTQVKGRFHTIAQGETLYRLSVENNVSVKEIMDANPGLSAQNFKIGQVITIPEPTGSAPLSSTLETAEENVPEVITNANESLNAEEEPYKLIHVVKRRETIYRICKTYDITQAEFLQANPQYRTSKLRNGAEVIIPFSARELAERENNRKQAEIILESIADSTLFQMNTPKRQHEPGKVNAALILPFSLSDATSVDQMKMVEFMQGVLLGVEKLKDERISVNLKVLDSGRSGADDIKGILSSEEMHDMDLVILGSKEAAQIGEASRWSSENDIPLVLPLNSNADFVFANPHVFQLNTPQSYVYQEAYDHFFKQFKNPNIIIIDAADGSRNDFINGLMNVIEDRKIPHETIALRNLDESVKNRLKTDYQNIFIINSKEVSPLATALPMLQLISRNKTEGVETHLFGYPEYQTYTTDHLDEMYEVDTWFYSWFYTNNMLKESVDFGNSFRRAFGRQMMISYPNYASYGYDTSYYFLKGVSQYGEMFEDNLGRIRTYPVQMGFKFERVNNWGGFINRKVYFIHLSNNYEVEKIDFDR
ncbi:MAG: LysM peptidoglycan-binding domain-containing protein [Bacteroidaceae bacterium]|nr:LysM peptidoglycan-binding domain-containing protein [Bacteroidaceae bacterium]